MLNGPSCDTLVSTIILQKPETSSFKIIDNSSPKQLLSQRRTGRQSSISPALCVRIDSVRAMDNHTCLNPDLLQLAETIKASTEKIIEYLRASGQQPPSFNQTSRAIVPSSDFDASRVELNDAATDLLRLVNGPLNEFRSFSKTQYDIAAFQIALEFHVFESVPLGSQISLVDLAEKVGFDEDRLGRILRMLATHRVFNECERNVWEHTAGSVLIATNTEVRNTLWMQ